MVWALAAILSFSSVGVAFQSLSGVGPMKPAPAGAPRLEAGVPESSAIRVDSALVQIPVHVTNVFGANVGGLAKDDFQLWEDGIAQSITHFSMDDAPASVGLIYDCSGSMRDKMGQAAAAAEAFFHTANPEDEFFLIEFGDWPKLAMPLTTHVEDILSRILRTKPFGRTALLDALEMALRQMKKAANPRKALVILSDGGDNQSRRNRREIEAALVESDVQVYAMGLYSSGDSRRLSPEERNGPKLLEEISGKTGGRMFTVANAKDLAGISARISKELRTEYMLGYSPATFARDGKYHRITVKVNDSDLRVYSRTGYTAPQ
jgi:Ca-activated chloride channel family protein